MKWLVALFALLLVGTAVYASSSPRATIDGTPSPSADGTPLAVADYIAQDSKTKCDAIGWNAPQTEGVLADTHYVACSSSGLHYLAQCFLDPEMTATAYQTVESYCLVSVANPTGKAVMMDRDNIALVDQAGRSYAPTGTDGLQYDGTPIAENDTRFWVSGFSFPEGTDLPLLLVIRSDDALIEAVIIIDVLTEERN